MAQKIVKKTTVKKVVKKEKSATAGKGSKTAAQKKTPAILKATSEKATKKIREVLAKKAPLKRSSPSGMPEILRDAALKVLDVRKAIDIVVLDLRQRSPIADYVLVASGGSARQLGALSEYLREAFFKAGHKQVRIEGLPQGDWVLVDAGDILVHLFRPEVRDYYHIEEIWKENR